MDMDDVLLSIFQWLPLKGIHSCIMVNKEFNNVTNNNMLWNGIFFRYFEKCMTDDLKIWKCKYKTHFGFTKIMKLINWNGSIDEFYNINQINLIFKNLTVLPPELGQLNNLIIYKLKKNEI